VIFIYTKMPFKKGNKPAKRVRPCSIDIDAPTLFQITAREMRKEKSSLLPKTITIDDVRMMRVLGRTDLAEKMIKNQHKSLKQAKQDELQNIRKKDTIIRNFLRKQRGK